MQYDHCTEMKWEPNFVCYCSILCFCSFFTNPRRHLSFQTAAMYVCISVISNCQTQHSELQQNHFGSWCVIVSVNNLWAKRATKNWYLQSFNLTECHYQNLWTLLEKAFPREMQKPMQGVQVVHNYCLYSAIIIPTGGFTKSIIGQLE